MEIKGKIIHVLESRKGSNEKGEWEVQNWVLEETQGDWPKKISFEAFNKDWNLQVGQEVTVSINLESREYQGKWYQSIKAWKVDIVGGESKPDQETTLAEDLEEGNSLPF